MAPKKNKPSGYSVFVNEIREQYQRRGEYFPKKAGEAFTFVGPLWKKLSEQEKQRYNDIAKDEKRRGASDLESKFNSLGLSYAAIDAEKREKLEYRDIMMNTIKNTVSQSDIRSSLRTQKFYLCHVNFFYVNSDGNFKPAEIAFSEFNLNKGVLSTFHAFINPGPIETGYRYEAKKKSEDTHKIPIDDPSWTCGERDYLHLFSRIKLFLTKDNPNGRIPPVYTMPDDEKNNFSLSAIKNTIENLCEAANEEPNDFKIYELPLLYHELRLKIIRESPCKPDPLGAQYHTLSMALHDLEKDTFCYTKGIACSFHEKADLVNFCSQSVVIRLVYSMCDFLLNYLPDDLVEGGHAPKSSINAREVYHRNENDYDDEVAPLRRPQINLQTSNNNGFNNSIEPIRPSNRVEPIRPSSHSSGFTQPPRATSSVLSLSKGADDEEEDDDTPISVYKDSVSLPSANMSQNTTISGYTASASLSQSSYASEISIDAFPYLGRGRGVPRQQVPAPHINWALNAGRGSRLRSQQQNQ